MNKEDREKPFYNRSFFNDYRPTVERYLFMQGTKWTKAGMTPRMLHLFWLLVMTQYETYEIMNDEKSFFKDFGFV